MIFTDFKDALATQFDLMKTKNLFIVDVDSSELWDLYLKSFPEGTNPMYKERTEHDCCACRRFIKTMGAVVTIEDNKLVSIWDVESSYFGVEKILSIFVKSHIIKDVFVCFEEFIGVRKCKANFDHFNVRVPKVLVHEKKELASVKASKKSARDVFLRALTEISMDAVTTVQDLIQQDMLYRGKEMSVNLKDFAKRLHADNKEYYSWLNLDCRSARIRNTVLGELLQNLSGDMPLEQAVKVYESMVAPNNYKRPKALVTAKMVARAEATVKELGYLDSIPRRHATLTDVEISNALYVHRDVRTEGTVFDAIRVPEKAQTHGAEDIGIKEFLTKIVPTATKIEMKTGMSTEGNIMCLTAPKDASAKSMFQWDNAIGWSYVGNTADSIKRTVKSAGGDVTGVLRFSLRWNLNNDNLDDLDAHCRAPEGHISYSDKMDRLDLDCIHPKGVACENITWPVLKKMRNGTYKFFVTNYTARGAASGFEAELELDGEVHRYMYPQPLHNKQDVDIATVTLSNGKFELVKSMKEEEEVFTQVSMIMLSPNCWGRVVGNKHYFFLLKERSVDTPVRGFFNEFLVLELAEHRKVLEVLGSKTLVLPVAEQLCGLGFSDTKRAQAYCRVSESRIYKINF